jgi:hypothetical protein
MPPKQGTLALKPFLSLAITAKLVHKAATNLDTADEGTLNNIARMVAARTPVFALEAGVDTYVPVMPSEILEGQLEGGGSTLALNAGRRRLRGLAIRHSELDALIQDIGKAYRGA